MHGVDYDVAVVGASLAGCTAARLFGRRGLRVALVERRADADAYKVLCTHVIQAGAMPVLDQLGVTETLEAAGAWRTRAHALCTRWGWIALPGDGAGCNVRRETLDPLLRRIAAGTPGVDFLPGWALTELRSTDARVNGIVIRGPHGEQQALSARLVVGADGRSSRTAALARLPATVKPNGRFGCFADFRDLPLPGPGDVQFWWHEPDLAIAARTDGGLTVVACYPARAALPAFRQDREGSFARFFARLPDAPCVAEGTRVAPLCGYSDLPNVLREAARPGLGLVGDAALALDPLFAAGCGWAVESAAWLVEHTAAALLDAGDVDAALAAYAQQHRRTLGGLRFLLACGLSAGRPLTAVERHCLAAAAGDAALARRLLGLGELSPRRRMLAAPALVGRVLWSAVARRPEAKQSAGGRNANSSLSKCGDADALTHSHRGEDHERAYYSAPS